MFWVVWLNKNNNTYYCKKVKGTYKNYYIGYENQYNHEVILIIREEDYYYKKISIRKKFYKRVISFLENKCKKL